MDELIGIFRDSVVPLGRQQKGFKNALLLTDSSTGKTVVVTLWETEADATATGEGSAYLQEQMAKGAQVFAGQPTVEQYEVSLQ